MVDISRRSILGVKNKNPEMKVEEAPSPKLPAVQSRSKEVDKFLDEAKSKPKQEINRREAVRGGIAAITNASRLGKAAEFAFRNDAPKNPFDSVEFAKNPPVKKMHDEKHWEHALSSLHKEWLGGGFGEGGVPDKDGNPPPRHEDMHFHKWVDSLKGSNKLNKLLDKEE